MTNHQDETVEVHLRRKVLLFAECIFHVTIVSARPSRPWACAAQDQEQIRQLPIHKTSGASHPKQF